MAVRNINSLKVRFRIAIDRDFFCMLAFVMYFAQDAIRVILAILLPFFSSTAVTDLMIILMYFPVLCAFLYDPLKIGKPVLAFLLLLAFVAAFFYFTYRIHPEYHYWFFESSYPVLHWIFRPNQCIYAFLFVAILPNPEKILKALKVSAYLLLLYNTYRFLKAQVLGYWIVTNTSLGPQHSSYDLSYGYSNLIILAVFCCCGFREKKRFYLIISLIPLVEILLGGSRGPLLGVMLCFALMYWHYRNQISKLVRFILSLGIGVLLLCWLVLGSETILKAIGSFCSNVLGISSRTIDMLASGSDITDASGRDRMYHISWEMIKKGFWGYGAYGDRYFIGPIFWVGYTHQIFLEFLIDFGWIIGGLFCVFIIYNAVRFSLFCTDRIWQTVFIIFMIPCTKLLLSGSFWYSSEFFAALAIVYLYKLSRKSTERKTFSYGKTKLLIRREVPHGNSG